MASIYAKLTLLICLTLAVARAEEELVYKADFNDLSDWVVEQMPGGHVDVREGHLWITDKKGCSVWLKRKLEAPVVIRFDAVVHSSGRVSDLNAFWMATDPEHPEDLFHAKHTRTGAFGTYDRLRLYYAGIGGNENTTTRFRRYSGDGARPLLPEHDLKAPEHLLKGDRVYHLEITVDQGKTTVTRDGVPLFNYVDPAPLTQGWFAFRTVDSILELSNFSVSRPVHSLSATKR